AAGNGDIRIPWHVLASQHRWVWALAKDRQPNALYFLIITHSTISHDTRGLISLRTQRQDVAQSTGLTRSASFNDDDFIFTRSIKDSLLCVQPATMRLKQIRAERNEAQGTRHADQLGTGGLREDAFNKAIDIAAVAQLSRKSGGWRGLKLSLELERQALLVFYRRKTSGFTISISIFTLLIIHVRQHAHRWVKGSLNLCHRGAQTSGANAARNIYFNLNHVTGNDNSGARWGSSQNNIAGFQGHVLG